MKTLLLILSLALPLCVTAQTNTYFAVRFWGTQPNGIPPTQPMDFRALGTNATAQTPPYYLFSWSQIRNCIETNKPAMQVWEAAQRAPSEANLTKLLALYDQIPGARNLNSTGLILSTNIEASLVSGTNSAAQNLVRYRQINGNTATTMRIQAGILELFQRFGPVWKEQYKPESDTTP